MLGAVPAQYLNLGRIQNRIAPRLRKQELAAAVAASGGSRRSAVSAGAGYVILHFGSPPCWRFKVGTEVNDGLHKQKHSITESDGQS
jgi:hypothetical protein